MAAPIAILGGGLAGLSAALELADGDAGAPLCLIEAAAGLGGRARSLTARDIDRPIDNGQHALSANYRHTRRMLERLGTANLLTFQKRLDVTYLLGMGRRFRFRAWPVPAPFHFALALLWSAPLSRRDRAWLRRFGLAFYRSDPESLKFRTVREWLRESGEAPLLDALLWEPLTLATLNTPPERACAFLLYQVLKEAFLASPGGSALGIPEAMLGELFADPARRILNDRGVEIRTGTPVRELALDDSGTRIAALRLRDGAMLPVSAVIAALPPHALQRLVAATPAINTVLDIPWERFTSSPIVTLYFWLEASLPVRTPATLVDSPVQWIFRLPQRHQRPGETGYSAVVSAAEREAALDDAALRNLLIAELQARVSRQIRDADLRAFKAVREKRATFLQTPEAERARPTAPTAIANLFLAGDWTDTGLPATIEGAVLSGVRAAEALLGS